MAAQNMIMYAFIKDTRNVVVYIMPNQDNKTFIQIIIGEDGG
jgi:hypothetical protein